MIRSRCWILEIHSLYPNSSNDDQFGYCNVIVTNNTMLRMTIIAKLGLHNKRQSDCPAIAVLKCYFLLCQTVFRRVSITAGSIAGGDRGDVSHLPAVANFQFTIIMNEGVVASGILGKVFDRIPDQVLHQAVRVAIRQTQ